MRKRHLSATAVLATVAVAMVALVDVAAEKVKRLPIVDKAIEFHGGKAYENSTISLTVSSLSGTFDIVAKHDGGLFDYTVTGVVGRDRKIERKVRSTNDSIEQWDDGQKVELTEETAQRARDFVNARVYFPFLPWGLNNGSVYKEDLGIMDWDGQKLHRVKVTFQPGTSTDADDNYMYFFDPETGEMKMFGYDFKVGDGGLRLRKVVRTQRVGGILFSDQENWAQDGQGLSVDSLTPDYVKNNMKVLSTVELKNIKVVPNQS